MSIRSLSSTLLVLLSVLIGCGSGDSSEAVMSIGQYGKKADLICSAAANEQGPLAVAFLRRHPNSDQGAMVEVAVIPPLEKEMSELKALGLPRGHETQAEDFIKAAEAALGEIKEKPKSALPEKGNPFDEANELGRKLKLGDCSRNP
jgi:hypothetical protein